MADDFNYQMTTRIVWNTPVSDVLPIEVATFDAASVLIVTDPGIVATGLVGELAHRLEATGVDVAVHSDVSGNPTTDDVAAARRAAERSDADVIVAVGGGSAIDTAKATAMLVANGGEYADYQWDAKPIVERSHPMIAIPTTAGTGSEVSKVAVIADAGQPFKKGVLSPLMFAHVAIVDPAVTAGLPPHLTAATGIDAFVHALEAYTGKNPNPISDLYALESLRLAWASLKRATDDGSDSEARANMMLAAIMGGIAMDQAGLGLVHALSGGLCSHLHLHHGLANGMLLPYVAAFNVAAINDDRRQTLNELFGLESDASHSAFVDAITDFVAGLNLPIGLRDRPEEIADVDWDEVAEESMRMVMVHNNPRRVDVDDCVRILEDMR